MSLEQAQAPPGPEHVESNSDAQPAPTPCNRPPFKLPSLAFLKLSSLLGSERHEMLPPLKHAETPAGPPSVSMGNSPQPQTRTRPIARFPLLGLKRETRVGIAALLSCLLLVVGFAARKDWRGKAKGDLALLQVPAPSGDSNPSTSKDEKTAKPDAAKEASPRPVSPPSPPPTPTPTPTPPVPNPTMPRADTDKPEPIQTPSLSSLPSEENKAGTKPDEPGSSTKTAPDATAELPLLPTTDPLGALSATPKDESKPADALAPLELPKVPGSNTTKPPEEPAPPVTTPPATAPAPTPTPVPAPSLSLEPERPAGVETMPPAIEAKPAPIVAAPATMPPVEPPPVATQALEGSKPTPMPNPPALEKVPSPQPSIAPDSTVTATAGAAGAATSAGAADGPPAGWVVIPSGGKRIPGTTPSAGAGAGMDRPSARAAVVADGPRPREDLADADQVEPILHTVRSGENFWTISQVFYGSGRYFKALHAANKKQVPNITDLWVGDVIRIPPQEALDRTLIVPPSPVSPASTASASTDSKPTPVNRTSRSVDPAVVVGDDLDQPSPPRRKAARPEPEADSRDEPERPTYTVKPNQTLRSIARDTLGNSGRAGEIRSLNREVLGDSSIPKPGTVLTLPADAVIGSQRPPR